MSMDDEVPVFVRYWAPEIDSLAATGMSGVSR